MANKDIKENADILKELGIDKASEFDGKTDSDLTAEQKRLDIALKQLELEDRLEQAQTKKRKKKEQREQFEAAMKALSTELRRRRIRQTGCSHRKGGVGNRTEGLPAAGGDSEVFAFIKHLLPDRTWFVLCQRCGAEFRDANRFTGEPATKIGDWTFEMALMARTDNHESHSSLFNLEDHRTPEQIAADAWHPPRDEAGNLIEEPKVNSRRPTMPPPPVSSIPH